MNVVIVCQSCRKPLKIPVEGLGQKVRCPACYTIFVGKRDEFKPRTETDVPPLPLPVNDAILVEDDAAVSAPTEEVWEDAAYQPPTSTLPKKTSNLWFILLLVFLLLGLPLLICGGVVVVGALFWTVELKAEPSNSSPQRVNEHTEPPPGKHFDQKPPD
jgi:LSD1 subclass zinc finger protein